jgi:hypothetical protein
VLSVSRVSSGESAERVLLQVQMGDGESIDVGLSPSDFARVLTGQVAVPCEVRLPAAHGTAGAEEELVDLDLLSDHRLVQVYGTDKVGRRLPARIVAEHLISSAPSREWIGAVCVALEVWIQSREEGPRLPPAPGDVSDAPALLDKHLFPQGRSNPPLSPQAVASYLLLASCYPAWMKQLRAEIGRLMVGSGMV